jgi:dephospho-CoA kinase
MGGIASGKSAVSRLLAEGGSGSGEVIDADRVAHELLAEPATATFLKEAFGPEVLDGEGRPDRAALAKLVFSDPEARSRLEGFTHPRIRARIRASLEDARAAGRSRIVLDVPLLLENEAEHGLVEHCDLLVFVDVDSAERERRARETRGWPSGELARREAAQLPLSRKKARADHVIPNDGTLAELEINVKRLLSSIGAG